MFINNCNMITLNIHENIKTKLKQFIHKKKIPHIIFYGPSGSGKRSIMHYFIKEIYHNHENIKNYVMYINCAHSKGIRFIRDELKFFAKKNIHHQQGQKFKSIVLFNADKLTIDAQSALRRCIEQFSHSTRFFIVIENKNNLLKPILSRFCNIYIDLPMIDNVHHKFLYKKIDKISKQSKISLHDYKGVFVKQEYHNYERKKQQWLKNQMQKYNNDSVTQIKIMGFSEKIYNKGYSALDILQYIKNTKKIVDSKKYSLLIYFDKVRKEFRNEILFMSFILNIIFMRIETCLENISEM